MLNLATPERQLLDAIYKHHKDCGDAETSRGYLGMSEIGHPCVRYLWFKFRNCVKTDIPGRVYRLFETGNLAEQRFVDELKAVGCEVYDRDEQGNQFAWSDFGGHFSGHMDGCAKGIPGAEATFHVLEFKTHNDKSFTKLKKEGVQKSKPQHYCQCQCYMHYSGMTRALYFAANKNTDEIYTERIKYNREIAESLVERAKSIIIAEEPPLRIATRPDDYRCNQYGRRCDAHEICWGSSRVLHLPQISCKQCCYATPTISESQIASATLRQWCCEKHNQSILREHPDVLNTHDIGYQCEDHLCLPGLFPFAEVIDYTDGMILFKNKDDGKEWQHGGFCHSTEDLVKMNRSEL